MNILLWIVQALLALLFLAGGSFKVFSFEEVAKQYTMIPHLGWRLIGVLEMIGGVLLIVPAVLKWFPTLTPITATVLAVETLVLSAIFASQSLKISAENPLTFNVVMAVLAIFVAYGRFSLSPTV